MQAFGRIFLRQQLQEYTCNLGLDALRGRKVF